MAASLIFCEFFGSFWVGVSGIRAQSPATNEQPWASILYTAVVKGKVALPCDISPPSVDDGVALILWYKDEAPSPIYTLDARQGTLEQARQSAVSILDHRAYFNMINRPAFLQLDPVQEEDAGEYRCRVDFHKARTVNTVITLKVIVPPTEPIIYDDERRKVKGIIGPYNEGESLKILCESDGGKPRPAVTWWRDYALLDDTYTFVTGDNSVRNELEIEELHRNDLLAVLQCQASNNNITVPASASVTLDLNLKPLIVRVDQHKRPLSAEKEAEIKCTTSGSRPPAVITWWKGNKELKTGKIDSQTGDVTTSILRFVPYVEDNGKYFACRAHNPVIPGSAKEEGWNLEVFYAPQVTLQLGSTFRQGEVKEGNDVFFECNIRANPWVTEISWFFEGRELRTNTSAGIIISNQTLVLQNVNQTSRGNYHCSATNADGTGASNEVFLRVKYSPVCSPGLRRVYGVGRHETVRVLCELDSDPADLEFHWRFNVSERSLDIASFTASGRESIASYIPHSDDEYGTLSCWATNEVGWQKEPCMFSIVPAGPPEPLQNCTVVNHTENSIQVECVEGYNGGLPQVFTIEVYDVEMGKLRSNVTLAQPAFVIQGLPSSTSLTLVVYSSNGKGRSSPFTLSAVTLQRAEKLTGMQGIIIFRPVLGLLIGVVVSLVIIAIVIVISIKLKRRRKHKDCQGVVGITDKSQTPLKKDTDDMPDGEEKGPDIIPANIINRAYYTEDPKESSPSGSAMASRRWPESPPLETLETSLSTSTYRKHPDEITYVELSLPKEHHSVTTVRRKDPPTEYANIDLHSHLHLQTIVIEREEEEDIGNNTCETPLMNSRRESAV
ncbi:neural cell adhesion molecule 2-like [Uloborus diversus]|uniref:neural cell adhesion molecule 2-like n=1 Tax=Uloborus diversus TaxID=327109 RepID=UPI00240A9B99|nr:neural cell adhesion molecule 2-like [Uloborus diversus]